MATTKIQWTQRVWNPVTGCTKTSPGCSRCYAERMAHRLAGRYGYPEAPNQFNVTLHPDKLNEPLTWRKPSMIFVDSMGDLFHKDVPNEFILRVLTVIALAQQHTFQILTKRPARMLDFIGSLEARLEAGLVFPAAPWPLPNLWLGISAENQAAADERIPWLLQTPAAVRFVSVEPMLGRIDLTEGLALRGPSLDWVICGCESGPKARETELDWVRTLAEQCSNAKVPFFLKQLKRNGKLLKSPKLDGMQWLQFPEATHV